ncbi:unnamed protein product [Prorocentrum cordatum]|uniref:Uncharacterized protein n=1 Tax=Prorocentrum cordatum TaxID=2364126 RepID=A0ABN9S6L5_9DINO|nr:unnamed protein product [Polarella glacialis]
MGKSVPSAADLPSAVLGYPKYATRAYLGAQEPAFSAAYRRAAGWLLRHLPPGTDAAAGGPTRGAGPRNEHKSDEGEGDQLRRHSRAGFPRQVARERPRFQCTVLRWQPAYATE